MDRDAREQILANELPTWLGKGYLPRIVTDHSAYLVEQRTFSIWWMLAWGVIVPFVGLANYAGYAAGRWCKTVTITVDGNGTVWTQEDRTLGPGKEPAPVLKRTLKKRQTRAAVQIGPEPRRNPSP